MVEGIDIFREHLAERSDSMILIGGAACDDWFARQGLPFRATRDLDIVLVAEALDQDCVRDIRHFVAAGQYEVRERSVGVPILYRFSKPATAGFPAMLEFFSRLPEEIDLGDDQTIVPITLDGESHSLSAILLDDDYYQMLLSNRETLDGVSFATAAALIPLKAHAWLDLTRRDAAGEKVDSKHLKKHRADVFRLAATLPGNESAQLAERIRDDLRNFLNEFPSGSEDWPAILASIKPSVGTLRPEALREAVELFFQL